MAVRTWMTTQEAAQRLGVKPQTLYAYISRGVVRSERVPGTRTSRVRRSDVERLLTRSRTADSAGRVEVVIDTELTLLDPDGRLYYRGWNVADAAATAGFEEVAEWLWTGVRVPGARFPADPAAARLAQRLHRAVPPASTPVDRMRVLVAALPPSDPLRYDRRPEAVASTGRSLIAALVEAVPPVAPGPTARTARAAVPSIAERLWPRISSRPATAARVRLLDQILVLLADHELAASTLAARVAASTWADPYLVVQAGLAALGGPLHGASAEASRRLIATVRAGTSPQEAIGQLLQAGEYIPGFGHSVYTRVDPRAEVLLRAVEASDTHTDVQQALRGLLESMAPKGHLLPNIDFAAAALAEGNDMIAGANEVIFAVARTAGWLAHAIEEYAHRLRFRPRAAYVGSPPREEPELHHPSERR
jgi:citrate synthase